ncbi:unnamed protein product [Didymodactylos carnosus]|uniref:Uncharacterized protein n=1 Tax=Didymodactylos carnosus TaxID=1234261 RepID=A0A8S2DT24_9BILA|nr:unnamed protein product [Didymodactylos carnosus]CAF3744881.1 unnamed protein product [Didymodactylos carnosus]
MGNEKSTVESEEPRILEHPAQGEASDFYWACRNGEIERVKQLLKDIPYEDLNHLEPNGSTPLHAASYVGQTEIVHLLLHERGCRRDLLNRYDLTAYEEAFSDEIRQQVAWALCSAVATVRQNSQLLRYRSDNTKAVMNLKRRIEQSP